MMEYIIERKRMFQLSLFLILAGLLLSIPTAFVSAATTVANNVSVGGTLGVTGATTLTGAITINGNATVGNATSDTLTITARLAADLDPNANNTIDLGYYATAYKSIYTSSTIFVPDVHDLLYFDAANDRVGITSSTPSADLAVGEDISATTTFDFAKPCFRITEPSGTQVYYWPESKVTLGGWATSTVSCF